MSARSDIDLVYLLLSEKAQIDVLLFPTSTPILVICIWWGSFFQRERERERERERVSSLARSCKVKKGSSSLNSFWNLHILYHVSARLIRPHSSFVFAVDNRYVVTSHYSTGS